MTTDDKQSNPVKSQPTGTIEVWCTKYALTSGVFKVHGQVWDGSRHDAKLTFCVADKDRRANRIDTLITHGHWHTTEAAAIARVKAMVTTKFKGIAKQVTALDAIAHNLNNGTLPLAE